LDPFRHVWGTCHNQRYLRADNSPGGAGWPNVLYWLWLWADEIGNLLRFPAPEYWPRMRCDLGKITSQATFHLGGICAMGLSVPAAYWFGVLLPPPTFYRPQTTTTHAKGVWARDDPEWNEMRWDMAGHKILWSGDWVWNFCFDFQVPKCVLSFGVPVPRLLSSSVPQFSSFIIARRVIR